MKNVRLAIGIPVLAVALAATIAVAGCKQPVSTDTTKDLVPPGEVTSLTAAPGDALATLTWIDPTASDFDHVEVSVSSIAGSFLFPKAAQTGVIKGLTNGTIYQFTVKAVDTSGNRSSGVAASATPAWAHDVVPPAEATGITATVGNGQVRFAWTDPTDADFAYAVITHDGAGGSVPASVAKGAGTYLSTGLTNGQAYVFTIATVDASGNRSAGVTRSATPSTTADTTIPAAPSGISAAGGDLNVLLTWTDPADADFDHLIVSFVDQAENRSLVVAPGAQALRVEVSTNEISYTFTLRSVDSSGNISSPATTSATPTSTVDNVPPGEVGSVTTQAGNGRVTLSWTDPADADLNHIAISYTGGVEPVIVDKGKGTATITGLANGNPITFTIRTVDSHNNLSSGVQAVQTPTDAVQAVVVDLTVSPPTDHAISFSGVLPTMNKLNLDQTVVLALVTGGDSYAWLMDGSTLAGQVANSLLLQSSTLALGNHSVTFVATYGADVFTGTFSFTVVNN